jgi:hypothetical protein
MPPNTPNIKPILPQKTGKKQGVSPIMISTLLDHHFEKS